MRLQQSLAGKIKSALERRPYTSIVAASLLACALGQQAGERIDTHYLLPEDCKQYRALVLDRGADPRKAADALFDALPWWSRPSQDLKQHYREGFCRRIERCRSYQG